MGRPIKNSNRLISIILSFVLIIAGMPPINAEQYLTPLGCGELSGFSVEFEQKVREQKEKEFVDRLINV